MDELPLLVSLPDSYQSIGTVSKELSWSAADLKIATTLFERNLPPLATSNTLPYLFGVSSRLISAMGKFPHRYYRVFDLPKKSGGPRQIEAPRRFLKILQRWILDHILSTKDMPSFVVGFVKEKNIFDNATPHVKSKNLMVVDIENFFPSVKFSNILRLFETFGFPSGVAKQLASLCSLDGRLPQGAPTSPAIANLAFRPADEELVRLARAWRCVYTRYADDLAFSGSRYFAKEDLRKVQRVLASHGFSLNRSKSRIIGSGGRQVVAGIVVNAHPQPPRQKRRLWRALFHRASNHPHEFLDRTAYLQGIAAFVNQYDGKLALEYRKIAEKVLEMAE